MKAPLADRIRPQSIDDIVGQKHLLGKGKALRNIIESGDLPNLIFYGPSGIGKTTLASIIALRTNRKFHKLNGTSASTADIKAIVAELDTLAAPNGILLYLDEIQYFNKKQQQTLLDYIEKGEITLIASTTENPYFYIHGAILSRCTVFEFKSVEAEDIIPAVKRAFAILEKDRNCTIKADDEVLLHIARSCGGDVRKAMNSAELCVLSTLPNDEGEIIITKEKASELTQKSAMKYDREGDEHYDILSAFQKSIRGSDENAAVHYLARLLAGGDLLSPCRRLLVIASEDIGLAYPQAVSMVKACVDSALHLGLPEAGLPLAQATILLATAPKSNSAAAAYWAAMEDVETGKAVSVPSHLQDTHYSGASSLGRGGYKYPHAYPNSYVEQQYMPDELKDKVYYVHGSNKNESAVKEYWKKVKDKNG